MTGWTTITNAWVDESQEFHLENRKQRRRNRALNRKKVVQIDIETGAMINLYQKEP